MSDRPSIFATGIGDNEKPVDGNTGDNGSKLDAASGDTATAERPRFSFIDPGTIASEGSGGNSDSGLTGEPVRKRRGRKPGSTNSKAAKTLSVDGLASIIVNAHAMLAAFTKSAELLLDEKEAAELAQATANVSRHYDVAMAAKTVDWINFSMVAGMIYGTRIVAIRNRRMEERKKNPPPPKPTKATHDPYEGVYIEPGFTNFQAN